jgi:alpha-L-fucosidase
MSTPRPGEPGAFGMFIHFNHSAGAGWDLSWPMLGVPNLPGATEPIGVDRYYQTVESFDPAPNCPAHWAAWAKRVGMTYGVFTTKHHDGVANFPSASPSRQIPHGRDLVAEFVDAFRAEGLGVGLYFSLSDWGHPDYPAWRDDMAPYTFIAYPRPDPEAWQRFRAHLLAQLQQLLTGYGTIDYLWFDGGWERTADEWGSAELEERIRTWQPGILLNDRLPGARADVTTPEQLIPPQPRDEPWEACVTMNRSWGWVPTDTDLKSARELAVLRCEVTGRGGGLLLNVSPTGDGSLPPEQVERLEALAAWTDRHRELFDGTGVGLEPWQFYGPTLCRPDTVYLCCPYRPTGTVVLRGVRTRRVRAVRAVGVGRDLVHHERLAAIDEVLGGDPVGELHIEVPEDAIDPLATVIAVHLDGSER